MPPPHRPRIGPRPAPNSRMRINPKLKCFMDFVVQWSPLVMIVGTIFWSYYAFVYHVCVVILTGVQQIVALIVYHIVFVLFMWSYWRSTVTRPTFVPDVYKLDDGIMTEILLSSGREEIGRILQGVADKNEFNVETRTTLPKQMRHCSDCSVLKPDRAHHCSICGGCVLKLDHHCPWVANCVGYSNYKYFLLFVFYGLTYCGIIIGFTLTPFINFCLGYWTWSWETRNEMVAVFFVGAGFAIALGLLWSFHVSLVVRNLTTMEAFRPPFFVYGKDKKGFNLGLRVNFLQVFGDDWKLWLLPLYSSQGDGCNWPTRCDATGAVRPRIPRPICSFSKTRVADISWANPANASSNESTNFVDSNDSIVDKEGDQGSVSVPLDTTTATEGDEYFSACASSFDNSSVFIMNMDTSQTPNQEMLGADVENNDVEGTGGGQASGDMDPEECTGVTVEGSRGCDEN